MHHQHPRKRFGQHFLHDPGVLDRLVSAIAIQPQDHLVEIGPGRGALTDQLLRHTHHLDAVELDRDLFADLQDRHDPRLRLYNADALHFDFRQLTQNATRLRVVGNLPYNISTPLLFHLLDQSDCIQDLHLMLQKEVVQRMVSPPGSKIYGRLSVMVQARCQVRALFEVGSGAFNPPPKVDSAVVRLIPQHHPQIRDWERFTLLVNRSFSQRRKTLRKSLGPWLGETDFSAAGIDPGARPETLGVDDFARLSQPQRMD